NEYRGLLCPPCHQDAHSARSAMCSRLGPLWVRRWLMISCALFSMCSFLVGVPPLPCFLLYHKKRGGGSCPVSRAGGRVQPNSSSATRTTNPMVTHPGMPARCVGLLSWVSASRCRYPATPGSWPAVGTRTCPVGTSGDASTTI